jgi:hypothetical protein
METRLTNAFLLSGARWLR